MDENKKHDGLCGWQDTVAYIAYLGSPYVLERLQEILLKEGITQQEIDEVFARYHSFKDKQ